MVPAARIVRTGLLGAAVLLYLAFVGLLARFADLDLVGGWVTMTRVLLVGVPVGVGYLVLAPRVEAGSLVAPGGSRAFLSSAAAGAVGGIALGLVVLLMDGFGLDRIRPILIQVSPDLVDAIDFGLGTTVGAVALTVVGALGGLAGAGLRLTSARVRRIAVTGVASVLLFGLLQRIVPIAMEELRLETSWLYVRAGGLTWIGGAVVLGLSIGLRELWRTRGSGFRTRLATGGGAAGRERAVVFAILLAVAIVAPLVLGSVISEVLGSVMVYALLGLGLNIVVGFAGLLDLGYVAFYAFGAYAMALFSGALLNTTSGVSKAPVISFQLDFFVAIVIVAIGAALLGLLIGGPVLRLRGDYLAIVTLGLGEIVSIVATSKWAEPLVGGPQGMRGVTKAAIFGLNPQDTPQHFYYLA
ncbi:MAG: ABC transporter permease subunit, partial [Actinomycetota bacterium]